MAQRPCLRAAGRGQPTGRRPHRVGTARRVMDGRASARRVQLRSGRPPVRRVRRRDRRGCHGRRGPGSVRERRSLLGAGVRPHDRCLQPQPAGAGKSRALLHATGVAVGALQRIVLVARPGRARPTDRGEGGPVAYDLRVRAHIEQQSPHVSGRYTERSSSHVAARAGEDTRLPREERAHAVGAPRLTDAALGRCGVPRRSARSRRCRHGWWGRGRSGCAERSPRRGRPVRGR